MPLPGELHLGQLRPDERAAVEHGNGGGAPQRRVEVLHHVARVVASAQHYRLVVRSGTAKLRSIRNLLAFL